MTSFIERKCNTKSPISRLQNRIFPTFKEAIEKVSSDFFTLDKDNSGGISKKDLEIAFKDAILPKVDALAKGDPKKVEVALLKVLKDHPEIKYLAQVANSTYIAGLNSRRNLGFNTSLGVHPNENREISRADFRKIQTGNLLLRHLCVMENIDRTDAKWHRNVTEIEKVLKEKAKDVETGLIMANTLLKVMNYLGVDSITERGIKKFHANIKLRNPRPSVLRKEAFKESIERRIRKLTNSDTPVTKEDALSLLEDKDKKIYISSRDSDMLSALALFGFTLSYLDPQQSLPKNPNSVINGRQQIDRRDFIITKKAINNFKKSLILNPWDSSKEAKMTYASIARKSLIEPYNKVTQNPEVDGHSFLEEMRD